jgi:beta-lactamase superfamily II metal-dependent hydrolase
MDDVIKAFDIGTFYAPKVTTTTKTFENMVKALKAKDLKMTVPKVGEEITIDNATLTFLAPNNDKYDEINNYSIVVKLKYGNNSFIFMGDAQDISESEILKKQLDVRADILKVGHHGSHSSTTKEFLDSVNPKYAVISCGKANGFGHPHKETLSKLNGKNINVFRTDLNGTVIAESDGKEVSFNVKQVDKSLNVPGTPKKTQ